MVARRNPERPRAKIRSGRAPPKARTPRPRRARRERPAFAAAFGGFGAFLAVAILAAIGFVVGKVLEGDIDISQYIGRGGSRR